MNLYVKYENQEMVLSAVCGLELVLSLTWLVIGISFRNLAAEWLGLSPQLVCCLFASFIFQAVVQCWSLYKRYIYDYKTLVAVTLLSTVGSTLFGVVAVVFLLQKREFFRTRL